MTLHAAGIIANWATSMSTETITRIADIDGFVMPSSSTTNSFEGIVIMRRSELISPFAQGGLDIEGDGWLFTNSNVTLNNGDQISASAGTFQIERIADYSDISDITKYRLIKPAEEL